MPPKAKKQRTKQQQQQQAPALNPSANSDGAPSTSGRPSADAPTTLEAVLALVLHAGSLRRGAWSPSHRSHEPRGHLRLASQEHRRLVDSSATRLVIPTMGRLLQPLEAGAKQPSQQGDPCPQALLRLLPRLPNLRELTLRSCTPGWQWLYVELGSVLCRLSSAAPEVMAGVRALTVEREQLYQYNSMTADREELARGPVFITTAAMDNLATKLPGLQVCKSV